MFRLNFAVALFLSALSVSALVWPVRLWVWKLSLVVKDYGHYWVALACFFIALEIFCAVNAAHSGRASALVIALLIGSIVILIQPTLDAWRVHERVKQSMAKQLSSFQSPSASRSPSALDWTLPQYIVKLLTESLGRHEVKYERIEYVQRDSGSLHFDFYRAAGLENRQTARAPWVMVIHGGGWDSGDSQQLPELNWQLARAGYSVVSIAYRLLPSARWPAPLEDAEAALHFVLEHAEQLNLDPERWVVLGRSAGAQIGGVLAYQREIRYQGKTLPRPRGFISFYGPTDLAFGYSAGDEDDILQSRDLLRRYFGGDPWHAPDAYQHGSPLLQAHATFLSQPGQQADLKHGESSRMPTLIFHGKPDSLVWFKHSERLHAELEWQSTPVVFALFDTAPHGFDFNLSSPYGLLSTSSVLDFLSRVVR